VIALEECEEQKVPATIKNNPDHRNKDQYLTQPAAFQRQKRAKTTNPSIQNDTVSNGNIISTVTNAVAKRAGISKRLCQTFLVKHLAKNADISKRRCHTFFGKSVAKNDLKAFIEAKPKLLNTASTSLTGVAFRSISSNFAGSIFKVKRDAPTIIRIGKIGKRIKK